jgi:hypothetical protein
MYYRKYLDNILMRRGPFVDEDAPLGQGTVDMLASQKVL